MLIDINVSISTRLLINYFQDYFGQKCSKNILLNTFNPDHLGIFSELLKLKNN